jgi:hypothetical protein
VNTSKQVFEFLVSRSTGPAPPASISPDAKLAYLFGDNTVTVDGPDGQSTTIAGRAVTI